MLTINSPGGNSKEKTELKKETHPVHFRMGFALWTEVLEIYHGLWFPASKKKPGVLGADIPIHRATGRRPCFRLPKCTAILVPSQ